MATTAVLTSIGVLVISFVLSFIFYYIISERSKQERKQTIEYILSTIINFVIYVWVGKILLNIPVFIRDPLAVLAYPSDSKAFYVASFLLVLHLLYQGRKNQWKIKQFAEGFAPVFLSASFFYEFIQVTITGEENYWGYLILLGVLLIFLVSGLGQLPFERSHYFLMVGWAIGKIGLAIVLPYTTVFGYIMSIYYLSVILFLLIVLFIYNQRKVET